VKAFRAELSFYLPIFKIKNKKEKREIEQNKKRNGGAAQHTFQSHSFGSKGRRKRKIAH
jgi:hypothetical protein